MLTALDSEADQIKGLDLQVDDYITKPFSMPILKRKIAAILRRMAGYTEADKYLHYKNITLDLEGYRAFAQGRDIDLTAKEFEVLREFLLNQGRVYTRQNLINILWGYDFIGDERLIDTHIKNIRKKAGADIIETIRGVGYRIAKENKEQYNNTYLCDDAFSANADERHYLFDDWTDHARFVPGGNR